MQRTHPHTGRPALYLGRRLNAYVVGLPIKESEAILDEIWSYIPNPERMYEHEWDVGDILMWDNRCTMHRRDAFDKNSRRIMIRSQLKGEMPA